MCAGKSSLKPRLRAFAIRLIDETRCFHCQVLRAFLIRLFARAYFTAARTFRNRQLDAVANNFLSTPRVTYYVLTFKLTAIFMVRSCSLNA